MPWTLRKRTGSTKAAIEPRTERSRIEDRFERDLREALQDRPYDVLSSVLLDNFVALTIQSETPRGAVSRETRKRVNFVIVARRSGVPVAAIVLTTHAYGRDRRQTPSEVRGLAGKAMVPVFHLDPRRLVGAPAIAEVLEPHL
ncbi:hypothetical protein [Deinococcus navajonensis]|uniref:DUF2726 domain-containing protein n=1 Tax=Deinococcus navajonensis TaxID=309884 RepID=A0ABV8XRM9_9DEIO